MMETVFLFCTDAGTGPDGKLSIHGIFNELHAPDFPARQDKMILVGIVEWQRDLQGRIPFTVDLTDPGGMAIFSIDAPLIALVEHHSRMKCLDCPSDHFFIFGTISRK